MRPIDIMEKWCAGDWDADPDGGTCSAIMAAYEAGVKAAAFACGNEDPGRDSMIGNQALYRAQTRIFKLLENK